MTVTREGVIKSLLFVGEDPADAIGPNIDQLVAIMIDKGVEGLSFSWQPSAAQLTPDQRAAEILKYESQIREYDQLPVETKLRLQIRDTYTTLSRLIDSLSLNLTKSMNNEYTVQELERKITDAFCVLDMELVTLGNWVDREVKDELMEARIKARKAKIS